MERNSFVFYGSFKEAVTELDPMQRLEFYEAVMEYGLTGEEPNMKGVVKALFLMAKPQLDKNQERYENGKKGGRPKTEPKPNNNQTETNLKPNDNQTITKTEKAKPNVNVNVNENVNENVNVNANDNVSLSSFEKSEKSPKKQTAKREMRDFFEYIFFEKHIRYPQNEIDRFVSHYEKTGWLDKNGNRIVDKMAALKGWRPDPDAPKLTKTHLEKWRGWYTVAKLLDLNGYETMLQDLVNLTVNDKSTVITCHENLHHFIEMWAGTDEFKKAYRDNFGARSVEYKRPQQS